VHCSTLFSDIEESFSARKAFEKRKHIHSVLAAAAAGEMGEKKRVISQAAENIEGES
jgi:hypothetical protein